MDLYSTIFTLLCKAETKSRLFVKLHGKATFLPYDDKLLKYWKLLN